MTNRDELAATRGARIKLIDWAVNGNDSFWSGELIFKTYYCLDPEGGGRWSVSRGQFLSEASMDSRLYILPSLEAAKDAAQADYEAEVNKALQPPKAANPIPKQGGNNE